MRSYWVRDRLRQGHYLVYCARISSVSERGERETATAAPSPVVRASSAPGRRQEGQTSVSSTARGPPRPPTSPIPPPSEVSTAAFPSAFVAGSDPSSSRASTQASILASCSGRYRISRWRRLDESYRPRTGVARDDEERADASAPAAADDDDADKSGARKIDGARARGERGECPRRSARRRANRAVGLRHVMIVELTALFPTDRKMRAPFFDL